MLYEDFKEEFLLKYTERSFAVVEELLDDALSYYGESKTFSKGGWDCFVSIAKEGELQHTYTLYLTYEDVDEGFDLTFENGINNGTVLEDYCFNCESDEEGGEEEMVDKQTVEFNSGDMIYIAQINTLAGVSSQRYYHEQYWCDSGHQREYIKLGIAFKCKEDAERKTKELLGIIEEGDIEQPTFTQKMVDNGELPPIGSMVTVWKGNEYRDVEVVHINTTYLCCYHKGLNQYYNSEFSSIKVIKTPHEKLVDEIVDLFDASQNVSSADLASKIIVLVAKSVL